MDERSDNTDADKGHPIATFSVQRPMKCRFIRLWQTGKSSGNCDYLTLYGFEVFGFVDGPPL
jgi:hypothetical protein